MQKINSLLAKLPSIVWVIIIPLSIVALIGGIITIFYLLSSVEGFASMIFLLIALAIIRSQSGNTSPKEKGSAIFVAIGICFFALMGMAVDQTGNVIYNKPIEIFFCPAKTTLVRQLNVSHPLPGRTDFTQGFFCVDNDQVLVKDVDMFAIILVRFVEYVILGYLLMWLGPIINRIFPKRSAANVAPTSRVIIEGPN